MKGKTHFNRMLSSLTIFATAFVMVFSFMPFHASVALAASPGDVIVNEIMQNPSAVSDSAGEWFEVYNTTGSAIDLDGWTIRDDDIDSHVIAVSVIVPAGGYAVLGNNADFATNGLCAAGSGALIRPVMAETDAVYAATFISYLAAYILIVIFLMLRRPERNLILHISRRNFIILIPSAVLLIIGHLFRFSALIYSPVSIVVPITSSIVVFTLLFSWMVNRRIDVFNWRVIAGIALVLAGVFILYG